MTNQLLLIDTRPAWRLDRATRAKGLEGVANARAVLRAVDAKRTAEPELGKTAAPTTLETVPDPSAQTTLPLADAA